MIIVCAGCSFTYGSELWEEKYTPGYLDIKTQYDAFVSTRFTKHTDKMEQERRELSYTGTFKKQLGCQVINVGIGGGSQQEIVQKLLTTLITVKKDNPNERIVCVLQDTFPNRSWIWQEQFRQNFSIALSQIELWYPGDKLEAYELKDLFMKYIPEELMHSEYYMSSLAVQGYCNNNDIGFMHFHIWDRQYAIITKTFDMTNLWEAFFDERYCVQEPMLLKLNEHYNHSREFYLPGLHINCEAQEIMGGWLIEEMRKRNLI